MVCNFNPVLREGYTLGAPVAGTYKEILNSDDEAFGGSGAVHNKAVRTHKKPMHGFEQSITITLPPMSTLYFEVPAKRTRKAADKEKAAGKKTAAKKAKTACQDRKDQKGCREGKSTRKARPQAQGRSRPCRRKTKKRARKAKGAVSPSTQKARPQAQGRGRTQGGKSTRKRPANEGASRRNDRPAPHNIVEPFPNQEIGNVKGENKAMAKEIVAMILAGGRGSRLYALTQKTAKPAVSFGGKYRIVDFPLSNCVNSNIDTVGIATQYQPQKLNEYIGNGQPWDLDRLYGGVHTLPPYEQAKGTDWYKGTANAIYQNISFIDSYDPEYVIILSGDQICKQDYADFLRFHKEKGAEFSVAVMEVDWKEASRFGLMVADENDRSPSSRRSPRYPSPIWLPWASTSSTGMC